MAGTMSLATSYLGGQLGVYLDKPINTITSGISNSLLKNVVNGALANSATGFILGTGMYLVNGQSVGQALRGGAYDAGMGALTGSLSGLATGFGERQQARRQEVLDTNVQADPVQKIVEETVHDPNLSHEGGTNSVYLGRDNDGNIRYVGITERPPEQRFVEHLSSNSPRENLKYEIIKGTGNLSRIDARIIEQKLINTYQLENLYNKINSISPKYWTKYGITNN